MYLQQIVPALNPQNPLHLASIQLNFFLPFVILRKLYQVLTTHLWKKPKWILELFWLLKLLRLIILLLGALGLQMVLQ
jgi:hypothetical protein